MLSKEELRALSDLARISLTPEEETIFLKDINGILAVFEELDRIPMPGKSSHNETLNSGSRSDVVVRSSIDPFSNATQVESKKFKAPKLVE